MKELYVYRCTECGKWSHAQKRPGFHQRFTHNQPDDESLIISYEDGVYDHMNGFSSEGGYFVKCGPFETYLAQLLPASCLNKVLHDPHFIDGTWRCTGNGHLQDR